MTRPEPLRWRQIGTGPRQAMALHCSLAHGGEWTGVGALLPELRIAAPDLLGHGMSPDWDGRGDYHTALTRAVIALIEDIAAGHPIDLIGHSLGGTLALRVALERPELVRSLVLVEPVLFAAARAADPAAFAAHRAVFRPFHDAMAQGDARQAAELFHGAWGTGRLDDLAARHRDYIVDRIGLVMAVDAAVTEDHAGLLGWQRLEALGLPVLLLEGAASPPVVAAIQAELARRLPMAEREVIPGAAHMLPVTHATEVAAAISAHLARNSGGDE